MTNKAKELTPAQKAAQTRAANKAAKAAQGAREAVQEVSEPAPEPTPRMDYKAVVEKLQEVYGLGVNVTVSRTKFEEILEAFGTTEDK